MSLRRQLLELNEQRECDRQSILILQNQIDSMRDAKCSDSFEASLKNLGAVAKILWNNLPQISISKSLFAPRSKKRRLGRNADRRSALHSSKVKVTKETLVDPITFRVAKDGARDA